MADLNDGSCGADTTMSEDAIKTSMATATVAEQQVGAVIEKENVPHTTTTTTPEMESTEEPSPSTETIMDSPAQPQQRGNKRKSTDSPQQQGTKRKSTTKTVPASPALSAKGVVVTEEENQDDANADEDDDDDDTPPKPSGVYATDTAATEEPLLQKPVKRARTAYFIFADERRSEIQKQHPGEGVAIVARIMGQIWNSLSDSEKLPYQQQAALEREQVALATEAWRNKANSHDSSRLENVQVTNDNTNSSGKDGGGALVFPIARIRKICKLDPEVRGLSKEATVLITKVAEMATIKLARECIPIATIQNRRKLLPEDIVQVCATREPFFFLREDIVDLTRAQHKQQQQMASSTGTATAATGKSGATTTGKLRGSKENAIAARNMKPLTDFFKAA